MQIMSRIIRGAALAFAVLSAVPAARGDSAITLSGQFTVEKVITCSTDTRIDLKGVTFTDCSLKLVSANETSPVTYTLHLVDGTTNVFNMVSKGKNDECIKATKRTNIIIDGNGVLEMMSKRRITDNDTRSGVFVCNNLTVNGGDITSTFDAEKSDTSCIFLKGCYVQNGGKVKVNMKKKNCTNELHGVTFESSSGTSFTLNGGKFKADIGGTKSRAIDLRKNGSASFVGGEVEAAFEGPGGRFVNGGTLKFSGGTYLFTTNITEKMQAAYYPENITAVKADYSTTISGGDFEADLPLEGSEVFSNDDQTGTYVLISGGTFDLVAGNDCIHANENIVISGGRIRAVSTEDDALDANGSLIISGGDVRAYATAAGTHGLDVNNGKSGVEKKTLTISGGTVIATDGINAIKIGENSPEVGNVDFSKQPTYYGTLTPSDYSGKYLVLNGQTNGVSFTLKPCLPAFPAGEKFNLLVSVPGRTASKPAAKTAAEAYADRSTQCPMVFEKKATVSGRTVTTKEGAVLTLPAYYDLDPATGKSKTVRLSLNETAVPEITSISVGSSVQIGSETLSGLTYQLQRATTPDSPSWTAVGSSKPGTGAVQTFTDSSVGSSEFYRMAVTD